MKTHFVPNCELSAIATIVTNNGRTLTQWQEPIDGLTYWLDEDGQPADEEALEQQDAEWASQWEAEEAEYWNRMYEGTADGSYCDNWLDWS